MQEESHLKHGVLRQAKSQLIYNATWFHVRRRPAISWHAGVILHLLPPVQLRLQPIHIFLSFARWRTSWGVQTTEQWMQLQFFTHTRSPLAQPAKFFSHQQGCHLAKSSSLVTRSHYAGASINCRSRHQYSMLYLSSHQTHFEEDLCKQTISYFKSVCSLPWKMH